MKQITNKNNILKDISTEKAQQFDEVVRLILQTKKQVLHLANRALIELYWQIGGFISQKIAHSVWGDSVVAQLAVYIKKNYPNIKGFSDKNLWRMKQFYELYAGCEKLSPLVRELRTQRFQAA